MARRPAPSTLITVSGRKQRITQDQILALKGATTAGQRFNPIRSTINVIDSLLTAIKNSFLSHNTYHARCKGYGHSPDRSSWVDEYPKCKDCGIEITSPDQLRKSVAVAFNAKLD